MKLLAISGAMTVLLLMGCLVADNPYTALPPGSWRGVLELEWMPTAANTSGAPTEALMNVEFEEVSEGELPFTFDVVYDSDTEFHIVIHNAGEDIRIDNIDFGRRKDRAKDSIRIDFPIYDSYITALYEENVLEGYWVVNYRDNYQIPFKAFFGNDYRFTKLRKPPMMNLTGKWEALFETDTEHPFPAVAELKQDGNKLTGTFRTETGDYRYLEGTVQADKIYLSVFDGAHAFLFEGKIRADSSIVGTFRSGSHYQTTWEARRNEQATLTDPNALTTAKTADEPLAFAFVNTAGDTVRLSDAAYAGKVKLIQIMGTWCPNCKDETVFLRDFVQQQNRDDLAVISLAFERYREADKSLAVLRRYQENMQIDWPMLLAGYHDKAEASAQLPMLSGITSYPTLLYVDRQNRVRAIHTGFNGPATSEYDAFKADFAKKVATLLAEPGS